jgi:hypothetical protein
LLTGLVYADTKDVDYNTASDYTINSADIDKIVVDNASNGLVTLVPPVAIDSSHSLWGNVISVWHMNGAGNINNNDTIIDNKAGTNNGTANGIGMAYQTGRLNQGIDFDGADNYVNIGSVGSAGIADPNTNSEGTIMAWVKRSGGGVIYSEQENTPSATLMLTATYFSIHDGGAFKTVNTFTSPPTGEWYHLAATWDSDSIDIYLNGVGNSADYSGTTQPFKTPMIGTNYGGGFVAGSFSGLIDEVVIFNKALSPVEIQSFLYPQDKHYVKYDAGSVWQSGDLDILNSITPSFGGGNEGTVEYSFEIDGVDKWFTGRYQYWKFVE